MQKGVNAMLTLNDIHALASRPKQSENSVLTLYLDIDQSNQANLNRGFESQLRDMVAETKKTIDRPEELNSFETACQWMRRRVVECHVSARSVVVVFDLADGFFWAKQLDLPLPNRLHWSREVLIEPLVAALDEYERVGIVLLDRANIRVLTMFLGKVEEQVKDGFDQRKVRHTKTVGMNKLGAASHAQHRADEQVRMNVRRMVERIEGVVKALSVHRLILAGSPEMTAELRALLPKRLASQVIGTLDLAKNATLEEIRLAAAPLADGFERESEQALVRELVTSAAKAGPVVAGLAHTLHAVNQGRVWQLVYVDGFRALGYECSECNALFAWEQISCSLCGSSIRPIENVVEHAVARVARQGTKVEIIRCEDAGSSLSNVGGIGAFLRTRNAKVRAS
jgi:hypothetical protein